MKLSYALLAGACMMQLQAADKQPKEFDLNDVIVYPLARSPELADKCSKLWHDTLGTKNDSDYEAIEEAQTAFIASHDQENNLPIMCVAILHNQLPIMYAQSIWGKNKNMIGMGALRATCYPQKGEVAWADENPECTPWLAEVCVAEAYQKKGVGIKIAEQLFKVALRLKHETVYLHSEDTTNQEIYKRNGAVKVADVMREDKKNNRQVPGVVYKVDTLKAIQKCISRQYEGIVE